MSYDRHSHKVYASYENEGERHEEEYLGRFAAEELKTRGDEIAEYLGEQYWHNSGGDDSLFPLKIRLFLTSDPDEAPFWVGSVELEYEPSFAAYEQREPSDDDFDYEDEDDFEASEDY